MPEIKCECEDPNDPDDNRIGECEVHVRCDVHCGALLEPKEDVEVLQAYVHWRRHQSLGGCSHGH